MSLEDKMEVDNRSIYVGNVSKTIFYIYFISLRNIIN